jgi:cell wall-associated NlpC family hydrolase
VRVLTSTNGFRSLSVCAGLLVSSPSVADTTLTLELPPSQASLERQEQEKARKAEKVGRTAVVPQRGGVPRASRSGRYASRGRTNERVVGRLGVMERQAGIFRTRSESGRQLINAPSGTYVAVQEERNGWTGVLMADGSTGWTRQENVQVLDYEVVSSGNSWVPMSRGGTAADGSRDIYPRSNTVYFTGDSQALIQNAYKYLGVKYVWGGNGMSGIDCSGLVKNVFGSQGFVLPRLGSDQMAYGIAVSRDQLLPGDRLYFGRRKDRLGVTHTGLYIGDGYFIHSSSSRKGVAINHLNEPMWARLLECARR